MRFQDLLKRLCPQQALLPTRSCRGLYHWAYYSTDNCQTKEIKSLTSPWLCPHAHRLCISICLRTDRYFSSRLYKQKTITNNSQNLRIPCPFESRQVPRLTMPQLSAMPSPYAFPFFISPVNSNPFSSQVLPQVNSARRRNCPSSSLNSIVDCVKLISVAGLRRRFQKYLVLPYSLVFLLINQCI